jgi:hypothetical protein
MHAYRCVCAVVQQFIVVQQWCRFDVHVYCRSASGAMGELAQQLRGGGSVKGKPLQVAGVLAHYIC